jgi:Gly-Xaa carboxypeptidase
MLILLALFLFARTLVIPALSPLVWDDKAYLDSPRGGCQQAEAMLPSKFDPSPLVMGNEGRIREWLGGAIRVPTEGEY